MLKKTLPPNAGRYYLRNSLSYFLFLLFICASEKGYSQIDPTLYKLHIDRTTFNNIYDDDGDEKIVLQFTLGDQSPLRLTLSVWPSNDHDYGRTTPDAIFKTGASSGNSVSANNFLGDQQIKRKFIKQIYNAFNPATGTSQYNFLILEPQIDAHNHIFYQIFVSAQDSEHNYSKTPMGKTDPSPPAHSN